jgi:hypothetical protein
VSCVSLLLGLQHQAFSAYVLKNENSKAILKPKFLHPNQSAFSVTMLYPGNEWMAYFSDCAQHISYYTATNIPTISAATYICHFWSLACHAFYSKHETAWNCIELKMSLGQSGFNGSFHNKLVQSELKKHVTNISYKHDTRIANTIIQRIKETKAIP